MLVAWKIHRWPDLINVGAQFIVVSRRTKAMLKNYSRKAHNYTARSQEDLFCRVWNELLSHGESWVWYYLFPNMTSSFPPPSKLEASCRRTHRNELPQQETGEKPHLPLDTWHLNIPIQPFAFFTAITMSTSMEVDPPKEREESRIAVHPVS
jgi:hypothetical protein